MAREDQQKGVKEEDGPRRQFILVDARNSDSYKDEHIKGAISIPLGEVDEKAERMLGKEDEIIVYCSSFSCTTSANEVRRLKEMGFKNLNTTQAALKTGKKLVIPQQQRSSSQKSMTTSAFSAWELFQVDQDFDCFFHEMNAFAHGNI